MMIVDLEYGVLCEAKKGKLHSGILLSELFIFSRKENY
jgi:hypothetical protein